MTSETWTIIISIMAIAIGVYAAYTAHEAGTPITGQLLQTTITDANATATEIATIVKSGVFAAEQLKSTGKLPDNNAAFQYALKFAQKMLPDLDAATLTTFIESMVPLANQIYDSAKPAPHVLPTGQATTSAPDKPLILGR